MTRTWIVRLSGFPFVAHGKQIDTVDAATKADAEQAAKLAHPGKAITVELELQSTEKLERALAQIAARRDRGPNPYARHPRRRNPMEE